MAKGKSPILQPKFDSRIYSLAFPNQDTTPGHSKQLRRGYMIWDKAITGYNSRAVVHFLYNPSTVQATYSMSDPNAAASLMFPNAHDNLDLRIPLNQTATWSLLFDRTYELWGAYNSSGNPNQGLGVHQNNPSVLGVLSDIYQMQQFTGMDVQFQQTNGAGIQGAPTGSFTRHQGILQLIPSFAYFGGKQALSFYGYISEWDFQVTHWTQFMVPMRCVINVSFTMLPPARNVGTNPSPSQTNWTGPGPGNPTPALAQAPSNGRSGR